MPYKMRLFYRFSIFSYKILNKHISLNFSIDTFLNTDIDHSYSLRVRKKDIFKHPKVRTVLGERSLSIFLCKFVNNVILHAFNLSMKDYKNSIFCNLFLYFDAFKLLI